MISNYQKNKKAILKYQKENPNYRTYRRKYEKKYREENKLEWNLKSWKSMQKKQGKRITPQKEINYILSRLRGETTHV